MDGGIGFAVRVRDLICARDTFRRDGFGRAGFRLAGKLIFDALNCTGLGEFVSDADAVEDCDIVG